VSKEDDSVKDDELVEAIEDAIIAHISEITPELSAAVVADGALRAAITLLSACVPGGPLEAIDRLTARLQQIRAEELPSSVFKPSPEDIVFEFGAEELADILHAHVEGKALLSEGTVSAHLTLGPRSVRYICRPLPNVTFLDSARKTKR
jgi:hypothetical protein